MSILKTVLLFFKHKLIVTTNISVTVGKYIEFLKITIKRIKIDFFFLNLFRK